MTTTRRRGSEFSGRHKCFFLCLMVMFLLALLPQTVAAADAAGTYDGIGSGRNGDIKVSVVTENGAISSVSVTEQQETPKYWNTIDLTAYLSQFLGMNSANQINGVDAVSGATLSSNGIKQAICDALAKASAETEIQGSGTEEDPYIIMNAAQLQAFAEKVDAGEEACAKASVVLGADIDLSGIQNWNPIGAEGKASSNKTKLFAGTFDGRNHSVVGMKISGEYSSEANLGLFSTLAGTARVRNVIMKGVNINVTSSGDRTPIRAGSIAGDTQSASPRASIVDHCKSDGEIHVKAASSASFAGGILGRAFTWSAIINCDAAVNVSAEAEGSNNAAYAGGITGMTGNNTALINCASFGNAEAANISGGADAYAGGLTGMLTSKTYNCYAMGNATIIQKAGVTPQYVGALAGQHAGSPEGSNNYFSKDAVLTVKDETANAMKIDVRAWSPDNMNGNATAEDPRAASDMASPAFADTLNTNIGKVKAALNEPALEGLYEWAVDEGRLTISNNLWVSGEVDDSIFAAGTGTEADPYTIETKDQLKAFAGSLNARINYSDKYIRLDADIDLAGENWTPVGGSFYRFDGDFNGNGKTISNLTEGSAKDPVELDGSNAYIGLFGWINEHARIHDLILDKVSIHTHSAGSAYVGGIAGRASGSDTEGDYKGFGIDSCVVRGVIEHTTDKGTSFIGGLIGHMFKGTIINSMTDMTMTGIEKSGELAEVGGMVGLLNRGLVANSFALGSITGSGFRDTQYDIEGMACVGNIAAVNGGYIANCYAQGDVEALEYSIDTGIITGWVTGIAKVYNCWYNEDASMIIDGRTVKPVDPFGETVAGGVSDEWGFKFPGSLVDKNNSYHPNTDAQKVADGLNASFDAFPIDIEGIYGLSQNALRQWTVSDGQAVLSDVKAGVRYVQPEIEKNLPEEPEADMQDGVWYGRSNDKSTVVSITVKDGALTENGTKVLAGEKEGTNYEEAVARARFKAKFGDSSDYEAADSPAFAGGSGTEKDPYRIENEAQLRYLAESINEDVDWQGKYFRQTKDIAITGEDWKPIGWGIFADADGDGFGQDVVALYPFRGNFDGNNHVISGMKAGTEEHPASGNYMGLFGIIQGDYEGNEIPEDGYRATVKNVKLENVSFYTENRWRSYIGGLVGNAQGGFEIDCCSVTGVINSRSTEDFAFAGGLSGSLMYGSVTNCGTDVDCTSWSGRNYSYAAGMSAVTNRATIANSYTRGNVHADADQTNRAEAGGFTGLDGGICINCYAMGDVEIVSKYSMYLGGFVGMAASSSEHRQCYYNTDASQMAAGRAVDEKRYAGKFVNESAEANAQAQTGAVMASDAFRAILENNRMSMKTTISQVRSALEADENGSSKYHSLYYNGDGSDLSEWVFRDGAVRLAWEDEKPGQNESVSPGGGGVGGEGTETTDDLTDQLMQAIKEAKAIAADGYTADSFKALEEAVEAAERIAADPNASEQEKKDAIEAIAAAASGLISSGGGEQTLKPGDTGIADEQEYQVIEPAVDTAAGTATLIHAKDQKKVVVPATVKLTDGRTYKVTGISANAFAGRPHVYIVKVGPNVQKLAKKAFAKSKVRKLVVKTRKLTKAGVRGSLKGSAVRTVKIKVGTKKMNRKYVKKYRKIFTKKNAGKRVRVM